MQYALWHMPSGNLVNTYDDEGSALIVARRTYERDGRAAGEAFALRTEDCRGRSQQLAEGAALLACALSTRPPRRAHEPGG